MFPLQTVLFPQACLPLHVFEPRYQALIADCLEDGLEFGVVLITRGSEVGGGDLRSDVGTVARIAKIAELEEGRLLVVAIGTTRFRVDAWRPDDPYPIAEIEELAMGPSANCSPAVARAETAVRRLRSLLSELGDVPPLQPNLRLEGQPDDIGWQLCDLAPFTPLDQQQLLTVEGLAARMELLVELCDAMADDVTGLLSQGG